MTAGKVQVPCLELQQIKVISALGRGGKGVVFLVQTESDELLALKTILLASLDQSRDADDEYRRICFEQEVLACFHHPLLPKLRGVLSTDKIIGYAIDYCPGRHLNSLRITQTEKMLSDDMIRFFAAELVLALDYLHGLGIVYRDLKPENVMIQENGHLMLVDFDLSTRLLAKSRRVFKPVAKPELVKTKSSFLKFFRCCNSGISPEDFTNSDDQVTKIVSSESDSATKSNSFVGTEEYIAPEIIKGEGHDFAVDWWCLGVTLYEMLYSVTPFRGLNRKETFYRILSKSPQLVGEPTALRDLIGKLLEKDPSMRVGVEEIKGHSFFSGMDWDLILQVARPPFIPPPATEDGGEIMKVDNEIDVECFVQEIMQVRAENR
ncbi:Serine/threonine-protein kinase OXI1 [Heracleum sosnowskyi]|uniref:non-specific serine/threonine protein kinase n=1 Tax=Heracleum sosnowskyi TaxID=360622 RepID=A0AAD8J0I8_9APIA|nr:Serine/threonine-protein kinase OXI1 [Heracleum sosnowskyi]